MNTKGILEFQKDEKPEIDMSGYMGQGKVRAYIADCMRKYKVKKYMIQESDLGRGLEWAWGAVLKCDIGKICLISNGLFYMENDDQFKKRTSR